MIFVSHDLSAVTRLCQRCVLLDEGLVQQEGSARDVVARYQWSGDSLPGSFWEPAQKSPKRVVQLLGARVVQRSGETITELDIRQDVGIEITYDVATPTLIAPNVHLYTNDGTCAFVSIDNSEQFRHSPRPIGSQISTDPRKLSRRRPLPRHYCSDHPCSI